MSEYLVQRQSLENIADEIRVLSGTTEPLGLTEMATNVNDANDEVADQMDLIAQVASALQGKSVPGGGEDVTAEAATYTDLLTDLEAAVDALPDAGSGGGSGGGTVETATFTLTPAKFAPPETRTICYIDATGTAQTASAFISTIQVTTLKNSLVTIDFGASAPIINSITGGSIVCSLGSNRVNVVNVTNDACNIGFN